MRKVTLVFACSLVSVSNAFAVTDAVQVPEPSIIGLMLVGLAGLGLASRKKK